MTGRGRVTAPTPLGWAMDDPPIPCPIPHGPIPFGLARDIGIDPFPYRRSLMAGLSHIGVWPFPYLSPCPFLVPWLYGARLSHGMIIKLPWHRSMTEKSDMPLS